MSYRVWYLADGRVKYTRFIIPDLKERDCATFLAAHPGATFEDMSVEDFEAMRPKDDKGGNRDFHKWRKNPNGPGVIVDPSVPDPPHHHQALLDEVQAATTVDELKALLVRYIAR